MRLYRLICIAAILLVASVSCTQEAEPQGGIGYVDLNVRYDLSVEIVPVTRSGGLQHVIALQIYDIEDGSLAFDCADADLLTEPVRLQTGSYRALATSGQEGSHAEWDSPFYCGEAEFTISAGKMAEVSIDCVLSDVMVTAEFSQEIKDNFTYSLEVSNGLGFLVFDKNTENRKAFFSATGELTWTLKLINNEQEVFHVTDTYTGARSQQHYALSFSLQKDEADSYGAGGFKIVLDNSLEEPTYHEPTINIFEAAPAVTGSDMISKYVSDPVAMASYHIHSTRKYTQLTLSHQSPELSSLGLPETVDLMAISPLELEDQTGIAVTFQDEAGNVLSEFGETVADVSIDLSAFADRMPVGAFTLQILVQNISGMSTLKEVQVEVNSSFGNLSFDPWGQFIYVKGKWISDSQPEDIRLQYRLSGTSQWTDFIPVCSSQYSVDAASKSFRGFICGLAPQSSYEVRAVSTREYGKGQTSTTDVALQLYNLSFDDWCTVGKIPYPYASGAPQKVWDTANGGTDMMSVYPTTEEKTDVVRGSAVRMESTYASMVGIGKFAAGNIYTGSFGSISMSPMGATLKWGFPFKSRPVGLKGWYKYSPVPVDYADAPYEYMKGQSDICQVQFALADWSKPADINTATSQFVDFSTANNTILAHKDLISGTTDGQWRSFNMSATYRDITRRPQYIVISASASRYGDYFTGGKGSVMLVDEFELVYDPLNLEAADRDAFFALFK